MPGCILVPLSLTPLSEAKLQVAQQQARALGAELLLLHVLAPGAFDPAAISVAEATARAYLDAVVARLRADELRSQAIVLTGPPAATIVAAAREYRATLLIIGSSNRPRLPRALLGSVADGVVRTAECPVLLVHPPAGAVRAEALLPLEAPDLLVPRDLGQRTVDLARIVGSATRAHELGPNFRPLSNSPADEQRFQGIVTSLLRGDDIPPVELYKLGFGYYVRDGHHRVAAARQLGRTEIAAQVIELVPYADAQVEALAVARAAFEQATGLTRIGAARPESYPRLRAEIDAFAAERGISDAATAARGWYDEVFRPLWRRVREAGLAQRVPGERAADVIARLAAWRSAEAERTGTRPDWDQSLASLATVTP